MESGINNDLISRSALLAAYDKAHKGPPGGTRKLIEKAPEAVVCREDCKHYENNRPFRSMIRVIGARGSGKTAKLLNIAAENGYVIVEPNARMTDHVRHMAMEKGLNVNVISAHDLLYRQHGVVREKYLVDELEMFMASLGIVGYSDGQRT